MSRLRLIALLLCAALSWSAFGPAAAQSVRPPADAVENAAPPDRNAPGPVVGDPLAQDWRAVRDGEAMTVSIPDRKAAVLVREDGEAWRLVRNGPLYDWLAWALGGMVLLLGLFYLLRGRVRIERGFSGVAIERFNDLERMAHWLMAVSFVFLGVSGLNLAYGRTILLPLIGKDIFGPVSLFLKTGHHYVAFAFMLGLIISFVLWVAHNIPEWRDLRWLSIAGGLFSKHLHPEAKKFNAGQKIIFWGTTLGGVSLFVSGWALLFPFDYAFFTDTVLALRSVGIDLPAWVGMPEPPYTAVQEQQFNQIWHGVVAVGMICMILAHIYIGSVGMEGAFDAMGSGEVDINWAREHHSLWVEEHVSRARSAEDKALKETLG